MEILKKPIDNLAMTGNRSILLFFYSKSFVPIKPMNLNLSHSDKRNFIYFKHPTRKIILNGKEKTIRVDPIKVNETKHYKGSSALITDFGTSKRKISEAIGKLLAIEELWIQLCYGKKTEYQYIKVVCFYAWEKFNNYINENKIKIKKKNLKIIRSLVFLALQESIRYIDVYEFWYDSKELANLSGETYDNWRRHLNKYWNLLISIFFHLDFNSVNHFGEIYD